MNPDEYLFHINEFSRELYLIASGTVELTSDSADEGEVVETTKTTGDIVGELSFFFGIRQNANARTPHNGIALLFILPKEDYQTLIKLFPEEDEKARGSPCESHRIRWEPRCNEM